jgi:hypothetical protein
MKMNIIKLVATGYQKLFELGEVITEFPADDWEDILRGMEYYVHIPKLIDEDGNEVVPEFYNLTFKGFRKIK